MRDVNDPDHPFPPSVEAGERFIFLSDADVWDTTSGCSVHIFLRDYHPEIPPNPQGLCHEELKDALLNGTILDLNLDELIDHYVKRVLMNRRAPAT